MNNFDKYKFYRKTQIWPLAQVFDYERWLTNFNDDEQEIAKRLIDYFIYIPDTFVDQMLTTVIGKCGYFFKQQNSNWSDEDFKNNCWYSFVPGEKPHPTDSGFLFTRKLRDVAHIPQDRIIDNSKLFSKLSTYSCQNVILVDDFVGTGNQACEAWTRHKHIGNTLQELATMNNHKVVYAPLIVNHPGYDRIKRECKGLNLVYAHLLNKDCSIFDINCPCWDGDVKLYNKAINLIIKKSISLGIPCTNGFEVIDVRGYNEQGLPLAFQHGTPDACPPIFYWESETWKPLVKKVYKRPNDTII